jgi:2-oxoglutarate ferredoxin oxidoreductase subunit alpha
VRRARLEGGQVAQAHLRHLNPFPGNLGDVLADYELVLVPEMNLGQLAGLIRAKYLVDAQPVTQVRGLPFTSAELTAVIKEGIAGVA